MKDTISVNEIIRLASLTEGDALADILKDVHPLTLIEAYRSALNEAEHKSTDRISKLLPIGFYVEVDEYVIEYRQDTSVNPFNQIYVSIDNDSVRYVLKVIENKTKRPFFIEKKDDELEAVKVETFYGDEAIFQEKTAIFNYHELQRQSDTTVFGWADIYSPGSFHRSNPYDEQVVVTEKGDILVRCKKLDYRAYFSDLADMSIDRGMVFGTVDSKKLPEILGSKKEAIKCINDSIILYLSEVKDLMVLTETAWGIFEGLETGFETLDQKDDQITIKEKKFVKIRIENGTLINIGLCEINDIKKFVKAED